MSLPPLRVLLVNRHMNIGGVETYLYRLCSGLVRAGHSVGLLTEGGLYQDKVIESGATLHKVGKLGSDWRSLLPRLRAGGYQVVHGHNYHSARVAHALARELQVPYLMSVHGPRPRLKQLLFREWSRPVVVMSEGDRENIRWWGGVRGDQIALSFYAIDTDRFHPGIPTQGLREELGLNAEDRVVAFISRFSNRKADVGLALLEAAAALREKVPQFKLLLVGEGPEGEALRVKAEAVNARAGFELARMIGPRRDVERFMALANVCVCTANTALEAMACGTPTIAAGRTGYFGMVGRENFEAARSLCFADHGHSPEAMSAQPFIRDLPSLLMANAAAKASALETAQLVAERTSIPRMTAQMEALYRSIIPAPTR